MNRLFLSALLLPLALVGCAADAAPDEGDDASVEPTKGAEADVSAQAAPFCLPGEKLVCTLGPPPVCSCQ
ncbi:MAG TPA: hypothetical protein VFS43_42410 [Polyangiaceae bacterium]|nr:hypothetical protein [Polyangiaceae bacterium]